jgi:fibronectin type 3 domain-containing protein
LLTTSQYLDASAPTGTSHYRITAVDSSGNESASAATSATRTALYSGADVGGSTPAGSHSVIVEGRDYDVRGGGSNINDVLDNFYYAYRQLSGDFDMRVRLDGLTRVGDFTKAGLMARESLTGNSRNAIVYGTPGTYGDRFSYRAETGGTTGISVGDGAPVTYPNNWLRLRREGNTFSGYKSTDGVNWTQIGPSQVINMPATVFFGMAVSARSTTTLATANFRQLGSLTVDAPPAAPSGLVATGSSTGIALNWNDNVEGDLAGYNVYRASSAGGAYVKLNTSGLLTSSAYNDTSAPTGATSFYRVTAVDDAGNESAIASTSALRPASTDTTPPAAPAGVATTPSTASIVLDWANNTETDLAGYNIYRSSAAGGTYTKLTTAGLLTASTYTDTTAPAGATSFYRITAVDTSGNESSALSTSATRPAATVTPGGPVRINFQANGSAAVAGYAQDNGDVFGTRANGWSYGWNSDHTELDRDRNINSNQLLDTLVHMKNGANWQIAMKNGTYDVKISVGDARYATNHTINVNGVNYWTNAATAANAFLNKTMRVSVTNGRLTVSNGASPLHNTRINYIEIIPVTLVNFQANGSALVPSYSPDYGDVFGTRSNGMQYGWNSDHTELDRDRGINSNQLLDTLVHMKVGANWQIAVANGKYEVKVTVGDARYTTPHTINVNGVNYWNNVTTAANTFLNKTMTITVTNGRITIDNGASALHATRINYVELRQIG